MSDGTSSTPAHSIEAIAEMHFPSFLPANEQRRDVFILGWNDRGRTHTAQLTVNAEVLAGLLDKYNKFWEYSPEDGWRIHRDVAAAVGWIDTDEEDDQDD